MVAVQPVTVEDRCVDLYQRSHQVAFAPDKRLVLARYAPPVLRSIGTGQRFALFLDGKVRGYRRYCGHNEFFVDECVALSAFFHGGAKPSLSAEEVAALYELQMQVIFENAQEARLPFGRNTRLAIRNHRGLDFVGMPLGSSPYDHRWVEVVFRQEPYGVRDVTLGPEEFLHTQLRRPDWGGILAYLHITFVKPDSSPALPGLSVVTGEEG